MNVNLAALSSSSSSEEEEEEEEEEGEEEEVYAKREGGNPVYMFHCFIVMYGLLTVLQFLSKGILYAIHIHVTSKVPLCNSMYVGKESELNN